MDLNGLLAPVDFVRTAMEALAQAALEAEMTEAVGAAKGGAQRDAVGVSPRLTARWSLGSQTGITGAAEPHRAVLDRAVRPLSAPGEGAGRNPGRDVRTGGSTHRGPEPQTTREIPRSQFARVRALAKSA